MRWVRLKAPDASLQPNQNEPMAMQRNACAQNRVNCLPDLYECVSPAVAPDRGQSNFHSRAITLRHFWASDDDALVTHRVQLQATCNKFRH